MKPEPTSRSANESRRGRAEATEVGEFDRHALDVTVRQMRTAAIVIVVCALAFWPLDHLLYPEHALAGFRLWRVAITALAVIALVALWQADRVGRAIVPILIAILATGATFCGVGFAMAGTIDTPYFHFGYMLPAVTLPMMIDLRWRIATTAAMAGPFLVAYFVQLPSQLSHPRLPGVLLFELFVLSGCVMIGQIYYRLSRESFEQRRELASHATRLEAVDRIKNEFFANVSHEFRTPLMLVMVHLRGMRAAAPTHTDAALRNCARLLILVDELLELARLGSSEPSVRRVRIDFARLVADVSLAFGQDTHERRELSLEGVEEPRFVWGDPQQLRTLVYNLLSNAFKFSDPSTRRVSVRVKVDDREARLEVEDNGVGIAKELSAQIFDRFVQAQQGASRGYGGVGLGLSLVREIARAHRGTVAVDSEVGRGSTFIVSWPQESAEDASSEVVDDPGRAQHLEVLALAHAAPVMDTVNAAVTRAAPAGRTSRVLLVEDDPDLRSHLASVLANVLRVDTASDGQEALERVRASCPDLIVTDLMTPRLSGLDMLRAIRADPTISRVPVLVVTARAGHDARASAYEAGADDCLAKPFDDEELLLRALNLLTLRREAKDLADRNSVLEARVEARTAQLRRLSGHLARVREEERKRLARELHDEVGQVLTGLKLELGIARRAAPVAALRENYEQMDRLLDQAFEVVRHVVSELRPRVLDEMGLEAAVEWCVERLAERTGASCELSVVDLPQPAPIVEIAAFRVVQETLTNVARHASANRVRVSLGSDDDWLAITITDDGIGFDPVQQNQGFGLLGMAERVEQLGGRFVVESAPGSGTVTRVALPVQPPMDELS